MVRDSEKEKKLLLEHEEKKLAYSYIFLLISSIIFFMALHNYEFSIFGNDFNYSIFILPFIFFLQDAILKEVGYKYTRLSLILGTITVFVLSIFMDFLFEVDFSIVRYLGVTLAYFVSQFFNTMTYYYMLGNYETPYIFVVLNFVFSALVYNMFYMLFALGLVFSTTFWASYMIIVVIQVLLSMICGILISLIKQGIEV